MTTTDSFEPLRLSARPSDLRMPVENLPYPIGERHSDGPPGDNRLWGLVGDQAVFQHIELWPHTEKGNRQEVEARNGRMNGELYAGLKEVFGRVSAIEVGALGSDASMTSAAELSSFDTLQRWVPGVEDGRHLFVFRSRDGEWAGFRWREESFRFRRAALVGFSLTSAMPARMPGGFEVWVGCVPRPEPGPDAREKCVKASSCYLYERWTAEVGYALLSVRFRRIKAGRISKGDMRRIAYETNE
ncbi:hypothetical protein [Paraburkholderia dilworthii]|uniref:hypothetical protein n=1 Tax=Paraburkholderia dilworthii TaxID=948106 RepID=UPI00048380DA|nr:hypothetical protein [Paraburkholderia dilworthii]